MDKNFISGQVLKASELNDIVDEITGLQESIPSLDQEEIEREQIRIQELILNAENKLENLSNEVSKFNIDTINNSILLLNNAKIDADRRLTDAEKALALHNIQFDLLSELFGKDMTEAYKLIEDAKKALNDAKDQLSGLLGDEGSASIDIMETLGIIREFAEWYDVSGGIVTQYQDIVDAVNGLKEQWASYTDTVNSTLNAYDLKIDIKNGEIETALSSVNTAVGTVSDYNLRLSAAEGTLETVMSWEDTINGIDTKITNEIDAAKGTITTNLKDYTDGLFVEYEDRYDAKYATKSEVNSYVDELINSSIKTWTDAKDTEIATLAERIDTTEQTVTDYEARISLVEGTKDEVFSIANTANQTVNTVQTQMDALSTSYTVIASKVDLNSSDISQLQVSADKINAVVVGEGTDESPYKIAALEIDEHAITSTVISTIGETIEGYAKDAKASAAAAANSESNASSSADAAANSASSANGYATSASSSAVAANTSAELAGLYAGQAESFKNTSESILNTVTSLKTDAENAKTAAELAKQNALSSANDALTYKNNAESYMNSANVAKNAAEQAQSKAESSKNEALTAATDAKKSETLAKEHADNANINYNTVFSTLNQQANTIGMIVSAGESTRDEDGNITSYKPIKEAAILEYISEEQEDGSHKLNSNIVMSADNIMLLGDTIAKTINTEDLVINGGVSRFNKDGSGYVANGAILWDNSGSVNSSSIKLNSVSSLETDIPNFENLNVNLEENEDVLGFYEDNNASYVLTIYCLANKTYIRSSEVIVNNDGSFEIKRGYLYPLTEDIINESFCYKILNQFYIVCITSENKLSIYKIKNYNLFEKCDVSGYTDLPVRRPSYKYPDLLLYDKRQNIICLNGKSNNTLVILALVNGNWYFKSLDLEIGLYYRAYQPGFVLFGDTYKRIIIPCFDGTYIKLYQIYILLNERGFDTIEYREEIIHADSVTGDKDLLVLINGESAFSETYGTNNTVKTPAILRHGDYFYPLYINGNLHTYTLGNRINQYPLTCYQLTEGHLIAATSNNYMIVPKWVSCDNFSILTAPGRFLYSRNHTKIHLMNYISLSSFLEYSGKYFVIWNAKSIYIYKPYKKNIIDLIYDTLLP